MPITILPQFGSSAAIAVLKRGELATEKAIFFAMLIDLAFITFTVTNFLAPSPSLTICFAKFKRTFEVHSQNLLTLDLKYYKIFLF